MKAAVELVRGLPRKELIERIYFHHHQGEVAERALAFYLLQMQEGGTYRPLRDAAAWAAAHLGCQRADKLILTARRLEELLEIDAAFAAGKVPWTKVREIARVATAETERKWLHLALTATTRVGALSAPFRARFRHIERLEPYGEEEIAEVVMGAAMRLGTGVSPEAAREVARRSKGTPREAMRILDRARDIAQLSRVTRISLAHVGQAAERLGIDKHGLDRVEQAAVRLLVRRGRPMGREALVARLGIDIETYRDVHEPWLERSDLIERTEAGRIATRKARALYGECHAMLIGS
jgi:hypothetical protein